MQKVAVFKDFKIGEDNERSANLSLKSVCTDMSAQWKGTGKGGTHKVCKKFCSCYVMVNMANEDHDVIIMSSWRKKP
jgi:hypothetical protein